MDMQHKVVVITGASSGIGLACADYLASKGHVVYGIGRSTDFKTSRFLYYAADVRNEDSIHTFVSTILEKEQRIDVLINNAGVHVLGAIEHTNHPTARQLFDCNFFGSLNMIRAILPLMKQRNYGMIICISSIAGITGLPFQGIYCASKFALEGLCESLRMETSRSGVQVVLLEPGDFCTPITSNKITDPETLKDSYYKKIFEDTKRKVTSDENNGMDPIHIARKIEKIMHLEKPSLRYTVGKSIQRLVPLLKRILPSGLFEYIIRNNYYA